MPCAFCALQGRTLGDLSHHLHKYAAPHKKFCHLLIFQGECHFAPRQYFLMTRMKIDENARLILLDLRLLRIL